MNLRKMKKAGMVLHETKPKKTQLEKIAERITRINLQQDESGEYLEVCTFQSHVGVIGQTILKEKGCLTRNYGQPCKYYQKYIAE